MTILYNKSTSLKYGKFLEVYDAQHRRLKKLRLTNTDKNHKLIALIKQVLHQLLMLIIYFLTFPAKKSQEYGDLMYLIKLRP
ncbi:hypothetical protein MITS9504_03315 [Synechococcus sp. MIT S9504]|nr:hypothetical protein MITS9504_03315 [Synechococcus sp. MIT S9504]